MSLNKKTRWLSAVLVIGLFGGFFFFSHYVKQAQSAQRMLEEQNHALMKELEELNYIKDLAVKFSEKSVPAIVGTQYSREYLKRLSYINDLAVEFSVEPMIVTLIDRYSREYLKKDGQEWRLLKTPEFLTHIMLSLIHAESGGNPAAIGDDGRARGLTQIWVSTAERYGEVTAEQLLDPQVNISFSFQHFHYLLKKYRGNLALALYAWNRGDGKVDRLLFYGQSPQNDYGRKVYQATLLNNN